MEDSTSSKPSAALAMTDGQPTGGMDTAALMRQLLAPLEQQGAGSSQSTGESICFILFRIVFFPTFPLCTECDSYGWALSLQNAVNCRTMRCNSGKGAAARAPQIVAKTGGGKTSWSE